MRISETSKYFFVLAFIEGGALMAVELLSSKVIAPYYGASLYVWTAVLGTTLGGLGLGYFLGGKMANKSNQLEMIFRLFLISGVLTLALPWLGSVVLEALLSLEIRLAVTLAGIILISPILCSFGMISPLIIQRMSQINTTANSGSVSGKVYGVSTIGGVVFSAIYGLIVIPSIGIMVGSIIAGVLLLAAAFSTKLLATKTS